MQTPLPQPQSHDRNQEGRGREGDSIVDAAATVGSISRVTFVYICTGNVLSCAVARKIETTTSSNDVMNAKTAPTSTPGRISGSVTAETSSAAPLQGSPPRFQASDRRFEAWLTRSRRQAESRDMYAPR